MPNSGISLPLVGLLAVAGALGTLSRLAVSFGVQRLCGAGFPWATLVINVSGCLVFGIVWTVADTRQLIGPQARFVVLSGFMGAYTTFSAFAFETTELMLETGWGRGLANLALQNVLGLGAVWLGFQVGRLL